MKKWGGAEREWAALGISTSQHSQAQDPPANQLAPNQRQIHLVEAKFCEDTEPENQLKQQPQTPSTPFCWEWVGLFTSHARSSKEARP